MKLFQVVLIDLVDTVCNKVCIHCEGTVDDIPALSEIIIIKDMLDTPVMVIRRHSLIN